MSVRPKLSLLNKRLNKEEKTMSSNLKLHALKDKSRLSWLKPKLNKEDLIMRPPSKKQEKKKRPDIKPG